MHFVQQHDLLGFPSQKVRAGGSEDLKDSYDRTTSLRRSLRSVPEVAQVAEVVKTVKKIKTKISFKVLEF